jgi:8-oxo-dGTP diphosphatase
MEIDKIAYIRIENGKILGTKSKGRTIYYIPGGKREKGETDEETLIREVFEELNVSILPSTIKYVGTFKAQADNNSKGVIVKMTCYSSDFTGVLEAQSEIEEIRWLSYSDIHLVGEVDTIIFNYFKDKGML